MAKNFTQLVEAARTSKSATVLKRTAKDSWMWGKRLEERKEVMDTISSFVPKDVVEYFTESGQGPLQGPLAARMQAAVLFVDISGFTALTEKLGEQGMAGIDTLDQVLNAYFGLMGDVVSAFGGDIVKYAGDAILILFKPTKQEQADALKESIAAQAQLPESALKEELKDKRPLLKCLLRTIECASLLFGQYNEFQATDEISLTLHAAISAGVLYGVHVGGFQDRWEYLIKGAPLGELDPALTSAAKGECCISSSSYAFLQKFHRLHPTKLNFSLAPTGEFGCAKITFLNQAPKISVSKRPQSSPYGSTSPTQKDKDKSEATKSSLSNPPSYPAPSPSLPSSPNYTAPPPPRQNKAKRSFFPSADPQAVLSGTHRSKSGAATGSRAVGRNFDPSAATARTAAAIYGPGATPPDGTPNSSTPGSRNGSRSSSRRESLKDSAEESENNSNNSSAPGTTVSQNTTFSISITPSGMSEPSSFPPSRDALTRNRSSSVPPIDSPSSFDGVRSRSSTSASAQPVLNVLNSRPAMTPRILPRMTKVQRAASRINSKVRLSTTGPLPRESHKRGKTQQFVRQERGKTQEAMNNNLGAIEQEPEDVQMEFPSPKTLPNSQSPLAKRGSGGSTTSSSSRTSSSSTPSLSPPSSSSAPTPSLPRLCGPQSLQPLQLRLLACLSSSNCQKSWNSRAIPS
eukprot:gb/GEZN01000759.1/.p1 GENE.gb/GEZN01000759.1/~~gb/GEZN01000759.1/.p1  ORF type:complete len:687 (+),score=139.80 gb/GEZN01000759.1/:193-2253(+)